MASLFEEEEVVEDHGELAGALPQTRERRSASSAVPASGLTRVFSSGASAPPVASLTAPFEDHGRMASTPSSAPDRSPLEVPRITGVTVGQALLRVLTEARTRDEGVDQAADALPISHNSSEFALRVASDVGLPKDGESDEAFGRSGEKLAGPWLPDVDFPVPDSTALLTSIGVSVFVITHTDPSVCERSDPTTRMEVVGAPMPTPGEEEDSDDEDDSSGGGGGGFAPHGGDDTQSALQTDGATSPASSAATSSVPSPGPWMAGGEKVVMRVRLPSSAVPHSAGEARAGLRAGTPLALTVERPTADGLRLAARFTVEVEVDPSAATALTASDAALTDAPPAAELASSLLSGALVGADR